VSQLRPFILLALCAALAACVTAPIIDQGVNGSPATQKPRIIGANGPLTTGESKALLAQISTEPGDAGILQRHLAIEQAVAESPLIIGNRTRLLHDGVDSFRAMFAAIRSAKRQVNLEYFILEDVKSGGVTLGDLLIAKRRKGVQVNIIYDSYGSSGTPAAFFDRLKAAGVNLVEFNPINPFVAMKEFSLNDRDHRKILVVDGATAIVGGVNLSTAYQSNRFGKSGEPKGTPATEHVRDTDLEIEGPAVAELQQLFLDHWTQQNGPPLATARFFPKVAAKGAEVVRIVGSTPDKSIPRYYVTLLSAIRNAEKSVWLSAAYFVPTHQEKEDLSDAARRGVDVRLLLPDKSDSPRAIEVAHSSYSDLLEAGVKIYESHDVVLHSKTVVIDGVWTAIGSSNFDQRSIVFNDEVDAIVLGSATAQEMRTMFEDDIRNARQIDLAAWDGRPFWQKVGELFSRIWDNML
jgi:cardiolipin synthase